MIDYKREWSRGYVSIIRREYNKIMKEDNMDNNNRNLPTQGVLAIRILIGGYLLYLSQSLVRERAGSSMSPVVLWLFVVFFTIVGIILIALAIKSYTKGEYIGGKADISAAEDDIAEDITEDNIVDSIEAEEPSEEAKKIAEAIEDNEADASEE